MTTIPESRMSFDAGIDCACPPMWPLEYVGRHHPACPRRSAGTRVPPIPAGAVCMLDGQRVRAYFLAWSDDPRVDRYEVVPLGELRDVARPTYATREQLEVCRG